jgi:hypothetical protein
MPERNQSKRVIAESIQRGSFLNEKPLDKLCFEIRRL